MLNDERSILYGRIDRRVDQMIRDGLVDEVFRLKEMGYTRDLVSMQGLGYKELFPYLAGECTLEEAVYIIKRDTRHFAKRQLTWFRREKDVIWLNKLDFDYDEEKYYHICWIAGTKSFRPMQRKKENNHVDRKSCYVQHTWHFQRGFRIWNEN